MGKGKINKLHRSNKAHERLIKTYNSKISKLCLDKENYSKSKHLEYSIKRFYHKSVLQYQNDHKKMADDITKKSYYDYAVRNTK